MMYLFRMNTTIKGFILNHKNKKIIFLNMRSELQIMYMSHQETGGFSREL